MQTLRRAIRVSPFIHFAALILLGVAIVTQIETHAPVLSMTPDTLVRSSGALLRSVFDWVQRSTPPLTEPKVAQNPNSMQPAIPEGVYLFSPREVAAVGDEMAALDPARVSNVIVPCQRVALDSKGGNSCGGPLSTHDATQTPAKRYQQELLLRFEQRQHDAERIGADNDAQLWKKARNLLARFNLEFDGAADGAERYQFAAKKYLLRALRQ